MRLAPLLTCLWLGAAAAAPCTGPIGDPAFQERLAAIDRRTAEIVDLRASFEQRRHSPMLKAPMLSSGRLALKAPTRPDPAGNAGGMPGPAGARVRWDTERPRRSVMTIDGAEVRIYDPEAAVLEVYPVAGSLGQFSGSPIPRLEDLKQLFSLAPMDPAALGVAGDDPDRFVGLQLTPLRDDLREHVTRVRVVLDARVPCVSVLEIEDADGERTEIRFTGVRTNTGVADTELALDVPAGTRVSRPAGGGPGRDGGADGTSGK